MRLREEEDSPKVTQQVCWQKQAQSSIPGSQSCVPGASPHTWLLPEWWFWGFLGAVPGTGLHVAACEEGDLDLPSNAQSFSFLLVL